MRNCSTAVTWSAHRGATSRAAASAAQASAHCCRRDRLLTRIRGLTPWYKQHGYKSPVRGLPAEYYRCMLSLPSFDVEYALPCSASAGHEHTQFSPPIMNNH